jgi:hypothetical protein
MVFKIILAFAFSVTLITFDQDVLAKPVNNLEKSESEPENGETNFFTITGIIVTPKVRPGVNPTKLFFCFLLLRLAILMYTQYFPVLQTLKLNNKSLKNEEIKVL